MEISIFNPFYQWVYINDIYYMVVCILLDFVLYFVEIFYCEFKKLFSRNFPLEVKSHAFPRCGNISSRGAYVSLCRNPTGVTAT